MACCHGRMWLPTAWTIKPRSGDSTGKSRHVPVLGLKHLKLLRRSGHGRATSWPCREPLSTTSSRVRSGSAVTAPTGVAECGSSVPLAAEQRNQSHIDRVPAVVHDHRAGLRGDGSYSGWWMGAEVLGQDVVRGYGQDQHYGPAWVTSAVRASGLRNEA
jgi:hypothetical protein